MLREHLRCDACAGPASEQVVTASESEAAGDGEKRWQRLKENMEERADHRDANQLSEQKDRHPPGPAASRAFDRNPGRTKREHGDKEVLPGIGDQPRNVAVAQNKIGHGELRAE